MEHDAGARPAREFVVSAASDSTEVVEAIGRTVLQRAGGRAADAVRAVTSEFINRSAGDGQRVVVDLTDAEECVTAVFRVLGAEADDPLGYLRAEYTAPGGAGTSRPAAERPGGRGSPKGWAGHPSGSAGLHGEGGGSRVPPAGVGEPVELYSSFNRHWSSGFEVVEVHDDHYLVRRVSDGYLLPPVARALARPR